jgi:hypothetical protein
VTFAHLPTLLSLQQAARFLRVRLDDVQAAVADGALPAVRIDDAVYVPSRRLLLAMGIDPATTPLPADVVAASAARAAARRDTR